MKPPNFQYEHVKPEHSNTILLILGTKDSDDKLLRFYCLGRYLDDKWLYTTYITQTTVLYWMELPKL